MTEDGSPPPGYYPDPEQPGAHRWWDGSQWATPPPPPPASSAPPIIAPQRPATNAMAIASLVCGLVWFAFIGSVLAVVFGHIALDQIERSEGREGGRGLAIVGLIVGYVSLVSLGLLVLLLAAAR